MSVELVGSFLEDKRSICHDIIDDSLHEIYIFNAQTLLFSYVNKAGQDNLDYTLEEFSRLKPTDIKPLIDPIIFPSLLESLQNKSQKVVTLQTIHQRKDKSSYDVQSSIQSICIDGVDHFVSVARDVTEQKKIEKHIKESEAKFRSISESSLMGIFIYQEELVYINGAFSEMLGYSLDDLHGVNIWDLFEDSMQVEARSIAAHRLDGKEFPKHHKNLRLRNKNGLYRHYRLLTQTIEFEGSYAGLGTFIDITDLIETKKQLHVLAQAVEQTADLVRIVEADGTMSYANKAFCKHSGYTREELIGSNARLLKSGEHENDFYVKLWKTLTDGETFRGCFINRKKDGDIYYEETTITPIMDDSNCLQNFVVTGKEVTRRVKLEEALELRASTDELTGLFNRHKGNEVIDESLHKGDVFSLLFIDIDYFKTINDTYGHDVGDIVLQKVSELLTSHSRKSDSLIRWGGEEFILIASHLDGSGAEHFAQTLRKLIESHIFDTAGHVTISIGISVATLEDTKQALIKRADNALYEAKELGRNCIRLASF